MNKIFILTRRVHINNLIICKLLIIKCLNLEKYRYSSVGLIILLVIVTGCKINAPRIPTSTNYNNSKENFKYLDFPNEDMNTSPDFYYEQFAEGGLRTGKIIDGSKEGKWLSGDGDFDENGNVYAKGRIWREEYFKNSLRDSIFRQFDGNRKIIYETIFKKGTGLWKEFHSNGELYFEIYTKDGYFTDTLRLYDHKGKIVGKRLYKKDSLIYEEDLPCFPYHPSSVPSD